MARTGHPLDANPKGAGITARNKHPGQCYQCGLIVAAGTGRFERHNGAWRVKHANVSGHGRVTCSEANRGLSDGTSASITETSDLISDGERAFELVWGLRDRGV